MIKVMWELRVLKNSIMKSIININQSELIKKQFYLIKRAWASKEFSLGVKYSLNAKSVKGLKGGI